MNQVMFSYLEQKVRTEFQSCSWDDSIARSFEDSELTRMEKSLKELQHLEDEIIAFQKRTEQLIKESITMDDVPLQL